MKTTLLLLFISIIGFSQTTLIPLGSSWKYLSQGSAAPTNWNTSSFSDAAWSAGNAQLGFGDEATVTPQVVSGSTVITTYFRKTISIVTPSNCSVSMVIDDGSVVYINGVEVNRFNLPTGTILYSTLTPTFTENAPVTFTVPASVFISGSNIIAVEVHQNALNSSDVSFDFKLLADIIPCSSSTVTINAGICTGSSYNFGGTNYSTAGTYSNVVSKGGAKKLNVPFGVIRWDAWYDSYLNVANPSTYNDGSGSYRSALSFPQFKERAPFFANPVPYNTKPMAYWNTATSSWVIDYRVNRMQWNGNNQAIYDQEIAYAIHAGIDYFATLWYRDDAPLSYGRKLFATSTNKGTLKEAYIIESIGGGASYNSDIAQIVADFAQPWYQKIGGLPLIFITEGIVSGNPTLLTDIIAAYGGPVYSVYQPIITDGPTSWPTISSKGFNSGNWYSTWGSTTHASIMSDEINIRRSFLPYSCDVVPLLTVSFSQQARRYSPPGGPINPSLYSAFVPRATDSENEQQIDSLIDFCNSRPTKVKCALAYAWNEYDEGGRVICPTRDTTTGLPNTHMIDLFRSKLLTSSCDSTTILNLTVTSPPIAIANITGSNIVANPVLGATYQWINCATSSTILGATSSTFTPTVNGSYAVIVNLNGCKVTSSCVNYNVLSDFESLNNVLSETLFYPNPTEGVFNIKFPTLVNNLSYSIKNILGQTIKEGVFSNEINTIDVSSFTNGTYFISIESGRLMVRFNVNK